MEAYWGQIDLINPTIYSCFVCELFHLCIFFYRLARHVSSWIFTVYLVRYIYIYIFPNFVTKNFATPNQFNSFFTNPKALCSRFMRRQYTFIYNNLHDYIISILK